MPLRVLRSSALGAASAGLGGQPGLNELPLLIAQPPELQAPFPLSQERVYRQRSFETSSGFQRSRMARSSPSSISTATTSPLPWPLSRVRKPFHSRQRTRLCPSSSFTCQSSRRTSRQTVMAESFTASLWRRIGVGGEAQGPEEGRGGGRALALVPPVHPPLGSGGSSGGRPGSGSAPPAPPWCAGRRWASLPSPRPGGRSSRSGGKSGGPPLRLGLERGQPDEETLHGRAPPSVSCCWSSTPMIERARLPLPPDQLPMLRPVHIGPQHD